MSIQEWSRAGLRGNFETGYENSFKGPSLILVPEIWRACDICLEDVRLVINKDNDDNPVFTITGLKRDFLYVWSSDDNPEIYRKKLAEGSLEQSPFVKKNKKSLVWLIKQDN